MIVAIHQPEHLPWLGFFHKMASADAFVLLDNVDYRHKYFQNRNRVRTHDGSAWLNVPVLRAGARSQPIAAVQIDQCQARWRQRCWRTLSLNYHRARYFDAHAPFFEALYEREWSSLAELNIHVIEYVCQVLGLRARLLRATQLHVDGCGPQLILDIALRVGADAYVSGISGIAGHGREFEPAFAERGITVLYQQFRHPVYSQQYEPFLPCMSVVDVLFNHGPASLDIISGAGVETLDAVFN